jgi:diguanylate cyclase (GGDEF)-like protein
MLVALAAASALVVAGLPGQALPARVAPLLLGLTLLALAWVLRRWHREADRARRYQRRGALLARAALELQRLRDASAVFAVLPELLVDTGHAAAAAVRSGGPEPTLLAAAGDAPGADADPSDGAARALAERARRERRTIYRDVTAEPIASGRGGSGSVVAAPVERDGEIVAVLEARRAGRFSRGDREAVEAVARLAEEALVRLGALESVEARSRVADGLARTGERLLLAHDEATAAEVALRFAVGAVDATAGAVLELRGSRLAPLAVAGHASERTRAAVEEGLRFGDGAMREAWRERRAAFVEDVGRLREFGQRYLEHDLFAVALLPVPDAGGETRALMALVDGRAPRPWSDAERSVATAVATALGAALQRLRLERQLHELLDVVRIVAQGRDPEEVYARAVDAAVRLIPGAEAATLLVREGDAFRYAAAHGYVLQELQALGDFGEEEELRWYRLGRDAYERGVPRRLRGDEIAPSSASSVRDPAQSAVLRGPGRVPELRATICVPIVAGGDVLGTLNVDNLSLEEAFGDSEMALAEAFGQQIGVIIRQTQARQALAEAAITDPVTGLGNREGFNRRLEAELARARRRGDPVHLVMMDLDGFKRINDQLGHHAGDLALQRVAKAMRATQRAEDGLFRWGGDEFALLVAGVDRAEARAAADRHAAAVAALDVGGLRLSLSTGIASWPEDGEDEETLLRRADDLMYRRKTAQNGDDETWASVQASLPDGPASGGSEPV